MKNHSHGFNSDLLMSPGDRDLAIFKYPMVFEVLDFPELRTAFLEYDKRADSAKGGNWKWGVGSIMLIFVGLCVLTIEDALGTRIVDELSGNKGLLTHLSGVLPLISAGMGLLGFATGSLGLLTTKKKDAWLKNRIMTERLRQFHFQMFVFRVNEIDTALRSRSAMEDFKKKRTELLDAVKSNIEKTLVSEIKKIIREDKEEQFDGDLEDINPWLYGFDEDWFAIGNEVPTEFFSAYRDLRIMHQIGYANLRLRNEKDFGAPKWQAAMMSTLGIALVFMMAIVHGVVFLWAGIAHDSWERGGIIANIIVTIIAFGALALRAIESGLQPEREVERYQQYRLALHAIKRRYDRASSQKEKLLVMKDMERLSFDEMTNFILTNERAGFVM